MGSRSLLLALRTCLLAFSPLAADQSWTTKHPSWPEPVYVGFATEPQTLLHGVRLLCTHARERRRVCEQLASALPASATGGAVGGPSSSTCARPAPPLADEADLDGEMAAQAFTFDDDEMNLDAPPEKNGGRGSPSDPMDVCDGASATPSSSAAPGGGGEGVGEDDGGAALHVALQCVELWALEDPSGVGLRMLEGPRGAGASFSSALPTLVDALSCGVDAARLRTRVLALRCLSICLSGTGDVKRAFAAPRAFRTPDALPPNDAASGDGAAKANDVNVGGDPAVRLRHTITAWDVPARELLKNANIELKNAMKKVTKKMKVDVNTDDGSAAYKAHVMASAAIVDCLVRRAATTAAEFARNAPAVLPLGGTVAELDEYCKLWKRIMEAANERGVADPDRRGGGAGCARHESHAAAHACHAARRVHCPSRAPRHARPAILHAQAPGRPRQAFQ